MPPFPLAAAEGGFALGDDSALLLIFLGIAVFAAIGALSHERDRAFSASLIYLVLGVGAAVAIQAAGVEWLDPIDDHTLLEWLTQLAVAVALFGSGLKLNRAFSWRAWTSPIRLLALAMPATIAAIAAYAAGPMGLSLGAAIALGAALAPTDPVLAGDLGAGAPGSDEEEDDPEPQFALTAEAGFNDGLALPFLLLGILIAERDGEGWLGEWLLADVVFGIVVGLALGALGGYYAAALALWLRDRDLLNEKYDGWMAIGTVLLFFGAGEAIGAFGFLTVLAAGIGFRRYELEHEYSERVHQGAEVGEHFGELAVILLLGSLLTLDGLGEPGLAGWLLVPLLLVVIRPLLALAALAWSPMRLSERVWVGWFGVKGVASLNYMAIAVGTGALALEESRVLAWTVIVAVVASICVHGLSATALTRRLLRRRTEAARPG